MSIENSETNVAENKTLSSNRTKELPQKYSDSVFMEAMRQITPNRYTVRNKDALNMSVPQNNDSIYRSDHDTNEYLMSNKA